MHAIVSILDSSSSDKVEEIWRVLEADCGLEGIKYTPIPHFSWHIAEDYNFPRLMDFLKEIGKTIKPFRVRTAGLGLFTGFRPVIYLPIVRNPWLSELHGLIWERVNDFTTGASPYYAPDAWIPHITLAWADVDNHKLLCAMQNLSIHSFNWDIHIDNLALVYQLDGQVGELENRIQLSG